MNRNKIYLLALISVAGVLVMVAGCGGTHGVFSVADPTERGLMWVAVAIVFHAFIGER